MTRAAYWRLVRYVRSRLVMGTREARAFVAKCRRERKGPRKEADKIRAEAEAIIMGKEHTRRKDRFQA